MNQETLRFFGLLFNYCSATVQHPDLPKNTVMKKKILEKLGVWVLKPPLCGCYWVLNFICKIHTNTHIKHIYMYVYIGVQHPDIPHPYPCYPF